MNKIFLAFKRQRDTTETHILKNSIKSKDFVGTRLDTVHSELKHWVTKKNYVKTIREREFCDSMISMYKKRYDWYLNKV